jgi:hypothetical protein
MHRLPNDLLRLLATYDVIVCSRLMRLCRRTHRAIHSIRDAIMQYPITYNDVHSYIRNRGNIEIFHDGRFVVLSRPETYEEPNLSMAITDGTHICTPLSSYCLYRERRCPRRISIDKALVSYDEIEKAARTNLQVLIRFACRMNNWVPRTHYYYNGSPGDHTAVPGRRCLLSYLESLD